jgi:hypothetical protein
MELGVDFEAVWLREVGGAPPTRVSGTCFEPESFPELPVPDYDPVAIPH